MDFGRPVKLALVISMLAWEGLTVVHAADGPDVWEPALRDGPLPNGQAFLAPRRAIKSYRYATYDIYCDGERYPAFELSVELTHQTASFIYIGPSQPKKLVPSLQDIASGKFDANGSYGYSPGGSPPPSKLRNRTPATKSGPRIFLDSPEQVQFLYTKLDLSFHLAFPW